MVYLRAFGKISFEAEMVSSVRQLSLWAILL